MSDLVKELRELSEARNEPWLSSEQSRMLERAAARIEADAIELSRLRAAIEAAPHTTWCQAFSLSTIGGGIGKDGVSSLEVVELVKPRGECNCWKAAALKTKDWK